MTHKKMSFLVIESGDRPGNPKVTGRAVKTVSLDTQGLQSLWGLSAEQGYPGLLCGGT